MALLAAFFSEGKTICYFYALICPSYCNVSVSLTSKEVVGKCDCHIWMFCFTLIDNFQLCIIVLFSVLFKRIEP